MAFEEAISNSMIKNNLSQISPIIYLDENIYGKREEKIENTIKYLKIIILITKK